MNLVTNYNGSNRMKFLTIVKRQTKYFLRGLIFRCPPIGLQPERFHLWLDVLKKTMKVEGAVVEIGCHLCGTAAFASKMIENLGGGRRYLCYDTFNGFVSSQFKTDQRLGTPRSYKKLFDGNSMNTASWVIRRHGGGDVGLIPGDIMTLPDAALPETVSACLIDVDLSEPVHAALHRVWRRLAPGGTILVDDCPEEYAWKARLGYRKFMEEIGLPERYDSGMGVVVKQ